MKVMWTLYILVYLILLALQEVIFNFAKKNVISACLYKTHGYDVVCSC